MRPEVCETCGKRGYYKPKYDDDVRRFCSEVCYENRSTISLGLAIVKRLGGIGEVAEYFRLSYRTVEKWGMNGIPRKYHGPVLVMVEGTKMAKVITARALMTSLQEAKARKAGLVGRKASTLPPSPSTIRRRRAREGALKRE